MYDRSDVLTLPYPALATDQTRIDIPVAPEATELDAPAVAGTSQSTSLGVPAELAYELFSDVAAIPDWMGVIRSARIINRHRDGRARRTAFIAYLERASMGYTLEYYYDDVSLVVSWSTARDASTQICGAARFEPLGPRACMMHYDLELQLHQSLPAWGDEMYEGHPASAVLSDFRDYVGRKGR